MSEQRRTVGHARHAAQGPHFAPPSDFLSLGLYIVENRVHVQLTRPRVVVGRRSDCDLCLAFPEVSRTHCQFDFADGDWLIRDLKSLNGIYVNDELVVEMKLALGDRVQIGSVALVIESIAGVKQSRAESAKQAMLRQIVNVLPPSEA